VRPAVPLALAIADLHISLDPPRARAETQEEWLALQAGYFRQVDFLARSLGGSLGGRSSLPVLCAGDIFDRWDSPAELINWALENLPHHLYAVPGQHDLPHHNYREVHRSAYWTLVQANKVRCLDSLETPPPADKVRVYGFAWGVEPEALPPEVSDNGLFHIAVCHRYVWRGRARFPKASAIDHIDHLRDRLEGFRVAIFGDNHHGFNCELPGRSTGIEVYNCGTFLRRKVDEISLRPSVGIIYSDGTVKRHFLDTSLDRFRDASDLPRPEAAGLDTTALAEEIRHLADASLNFRGAVEAFLRENPDLGQRVAAAVRNCWEGNQ
jgi:hypothetical protein